MIVNTLIYISGYCDLYDEEDNKLNHEKMRSDLEEMKYNFLEAEGSYEGVKEKSFVVVGDNNLDIYMLRELATNYNQESILVEYSDNRCELYFTIGDIETIGKMKEVDENTALSNKDYSYIPTLDKYFVCN